MSQLKLKIVLNKGREGIQLGKLAKLADEIQKFLELFSNDLRLVEGEWIADDFHNGSVAFAPTYIGKADESLILTGQKALDHITNPKTVADSLRFGLTQNTFLQYAKIALPLTEDDFVTIGVYNGKPRPKIRRLSKQRALEIERQIVQTVRQYGGFQGKITALFKSSNLIWVVDSLTGQKISCHFTPDRYGHIVQLLQARDAIVNVEGWLKIINGQVEYLDIQTIRESPELRPDDLDKFFGCDPSFTGNLSTEEYLDFLPEEPSLSPFIS
ncbi:MAG: hypothetical protein JST84_18830 [Acidobacteria bacterium]|nr:hypothetical protein [Acidobacteriota bacterium]